MKPHYAPFESARPMARYLLKSGHLAPEWCLAKITRGPGWWDLDEILMKNTHSRVRIFDGHYVIVPTADIAEVQAALGEHVHRLGLRALPTRRQAMTTGACAPYDALFCYGEEPQCWFSPSLSLALEVPPRTFQRWMRELARSGAARITHGIGGYYAERLLVPEAPPNG